ncbi:hypothetical protein PUN28_006018 [Cardiocondyla obscurior]|uniref:Uncharacterized protein n=1 Tax=Cardiocondyla obscurior TaxID=286306 RepID=A0AAW2GBL6_9HYME
MCLAIEDGSTTISHEEGKRREQRNSAGKVLFACQRPVVFFSPLIKRVCLLDRIVINDLNAEAAVFFVRSHGRLNSNRARFSDTPPY